LTSNFSSFGSVGSGTRSMGLMNSGEFRDSFSDDNLSWASKL
jgi:hypothetical protein